MKPGPVPHKGFDLAFPVATQRGEVMRFIPSHWYVGDFIILSAGRLTLVCMRLAERIRATVAEIQEIYSDALDRLATVPSGGPVSREFWLYSRNGALRYFRLLETGIAEIDCRGEIPMKEVPAVTVPEISPGPKTLPPGLPATISTVPKEEDPREPLRWLVRKEAAALQPAVGNPAAVEVPGPVKKSGRKGRAPVRDKAWDSASGATLTSAEPVSVALPGPVADSSAPVPDPTPEQSGSGKDT
jgi:hypothetical protein